MPDSDATWRVYLREWLVVYPGANDPGECWEHFEEKYAGRVRREDARVVPGGSGYRLEMNLWNLQSESKDRIDGCVIGTQVQRGSAEEQLLLDYSRKLLPDAG